MFYGLNNPVLVGGGPLMPLIPVRVLRLNNMDWKIDIRVRDMAASVENNRNKFC